MVPDVRSWWNFHRHFWWMFPPIWHHLQVHQECPCPPQYQEETWSTGGVLTWYLMSDLEETFTDTLDGWSLPSETISWSMSSWTPGRDLEDSWSLDMVPDVRSWWNFHRSFWWMLAPIWHHLQVHQEFPCPPIHQEVTKKVLIPNSWYQILLKLLMKRPNFFSNH